MMPIDRPPLLLARAPIRYQHWTIYPDTGQFLIEREAEWPEEFFARRDLLRLLLYDLLKYGKMHRWDQTVHYFKRNPTPTTAIPCIPSWRGRSSSRRHRGPK